jgi:RNA polymerase sigma-70 factor (ECF subfamily)
MSAESESRPRPGFATTHWSVVLAAGAADTEPARRALSQLCESYWYPLYAYLRRRGHDFEEARDLTQGFFAHLLGKGDIRLADPARGRFRSFLLTACKNYVLNRAEELRALKRGGGRELLSLDFEEAEGRFRLEAVEHDTPETLYEAAWARELLEHVVDRLRRDYQERGQAALFRALEVDLAGAAGGRTYADKARDLDMSEAAVKTAAHRMRKRFQDLLRAEIAETLVEPAEVESEIRALFEALSRNPAESR